MIALVVFDSLWGNTQAVAEEIAVGIGSGAQALTTTEATAARVAEADLLVAGSPVHGLGLPSARTKRTGEIQGDKAEYLEADVSLVNMRDWLAFLPRTGAAAAAFDTRMTGPFGRGGASKIEKALKRAGYRIIEKNEGFIVDGVPAKGARGTLLRDGERERAREWGRELAVGLAR